MNRVVAVVEGVTEQAFIRNMLAPQLALHGVITIILKLRLHKG